MRTEVKVDSKKFQRNLAQARDEIQRELRAVIKKEGQKIIFDSLGHYSAGSGTTNLLKVAKRQKKHVAGVVIQALQQEVNGLTQAVRAESQQANQNQQRSFSSLYHQLIAKDQRNDSGESMADFVNKRWYIPSAFAVKHHHDTKTYVYLVAINFGVQIAIGQAIKGLKLGVKAMSKGTGLLAKAARASRRASPRLLARQAAKKAGGMTGSLITKGASKVIYAIDRLISKVETGIQDTVDRGAIVIYDKAASILDQKRKV